MHNIQIDNEFKSLIPALSGEERVAVSRYSQGLSVIAAKKLLAQAKSRQQAANKAWIAAARAAFNPGQKQPCKVCGKFQSVAHAHHLTPLYRQIDRKESQISRLSGFAQLTITAYTCALREASVAFGRTYLDFPMKKNWQWQALPNLGRKNNESPQT